MENSMQKSFLGNTFEEDKKPTIKSNSSDHEEGVLVDSQKEDLLKSTKAKMGEIREDNERLKVLLARMVKDYQSLKMNFLDILHKGDHQAKKLQYKDEEEEEEPDQLISLSLGRTSSEPVKKLDHDQKKNKDHKLMIDNEGLELGLDCRFHHELNSTSNQADDEKNNIVPSSENSFEEEVHKEEEAIWPPSKVLKTMRSEDEEVLQQQTQLKKARVSVRARCDTPTMNDGCQWRKYGQKIAKGNPCPRAYYRCTVSPTCPVRKQVQRWADDMSILITTYEGTHNHPLPISATAMASTTSAAVSMLQCRSASSTSQPGLDTTTSLSNPNYSTSTFANLHGLNISQNSTTLPYNQLFHNSSISTANINSRPTITLDLTTPSNSASSHFNRFSSAPRYYNSSSSSTCLNFSSLEPNNSWSGSGYSSIYQPYNMINTSTPTPLLQQYSSSSSSETAAIAATTKVITSNPNFQSALAAAITSYMGNNNVSNIKAHQNYQSGNGASNFMNKLISSVNSQQQQQQGSMSMFSQLPFSASKSSTTAASGSPDTI